MCISCRYKYWFICLKILKLWEVTPKFCTVAKYIIRTLQQGYTNLRLLVPQRLHFVRWHLHILSINTACVSVHVHRAERTIYSEFHTSRPNCGLLVCHLPNVTLLAAWIWTSILDFGEKTVDTWAWASAITKNGAVTKAGHKLSQQKAYLPG